MSLELVFSVWLWFENRFAAVRWKGKLQTSEALLLGPEG